jgi:hypothetical protein
MVSVSSCVIEQSSLLGRFVSYEENGVCEYGTRSLSYKTFYGRNLWISVKS